VRASSGMLGVFNHCSITSRCHCNSMVLGNVICHSPAQPRKPQGNVTGPYFRSFENTSHAALHMFTIDRGIQTRLDCPDFFSVASTKTELLAMTIGSLSKSNTSP